MQLEMRMETIEKYLNETKEGSISLKVSVQRGDDQWKPAQKSLFVSSVIQGYPIPSLYVVTFNGKKVVIDGLQRSTAIREFYNNEFCIEGTKSNLDGKKYEDLSEEEKRTFDNAELYIMDAGDVSQEELAELFIRLNNGTALAKTQLLKGYSGYDKAEWLNKMCQSNLMTTLADFTAMQKKNGADVECIVQGMILVDAFLTDENETPYSWRNISRDEQMHYSTDILSGKSEEELKKYEEIIEYSSKVTGSELYKKTMIPAVLFLSKVAIMSGVTIEEFDKYVTDISKNKPEVYKANMGAGNVSKRATVGRIQALFEDFKQKYPEKVTMNIDFEASLKRTTKKTTKTVVDSASKDNSNASSASGVEAQPQSDDVALKENVGQSEAGAVPEDNIIQSETEISADTASPDTENVETSADTVVETEDYKNSDVVSVSSEADTDDSSDVSNRAETDVTEIEPID